MALRYSLFKLLDFLLFLVLVFVTTLLFLFTNRLALKVEVEVEVRRLSMGLSDLMPIQLGFSLVS